ncbi:MAG: hypothetical protein Tsb008_22910 [Rhodothalassiaceae bacterium]
MIHLKDPDARLDYSVDWTAQLEADDRIASDLWDILPTEPGGLVIESSAESGAIRTVFVSGGLRGRVYRLRNRIETVAGRRDDRSILIRIDER